MCYVVAKDFNKHGCLALRTEHGPKLVELKKELLHSVREDIEIVTISRPTAYMEYAPYSFANDEVEFISLVKAM